MFVITGNVSESIINRIILVFVKSRVVMLASELLAKWLTAAWLTLAL